MAKRSRELQTLLATALELAAEPYREAIAAELDGSDASGHWEDFRQNLARTLVLARLIGSADVYRQAAQLGASVQDARAGGAEATDAAGGPSRPPAQFARPEPLIGVGGTGDQDFVTGPFVEAVARFEDRVPVLRSTIDEMMAEAGSLAQAIAKAEKAEAIAELRQRSQAVQESIRRSFWASDVDLGSIVDLKELVADSIRGEAPRVSLPDFIDRAQLDAAASLTDARLETIYRNNVNSAANLGRTATLQSEGVRDVIPLAMIHEIKDDRTRPDHRVMDGYVNTVAEISRMDLIPPNGHNCRGGMRGVPIDEAARLGLLDENGRPDPDKIAAYNGERQALIDSGDYPDPGFKRVA